MPVVHRFRDLPWLWATYVRAEWVDRGPLGRLALPVWVLAAGVLWAIVVPIAVAGWALSRVYNTQAYTCQ